MKIKLTESEMRSLIADAISNVRRYNLKPKNIQISESELKNLIKNIISEELKIPKYGFNTFHFKFKTDGGLPFTIIAKFNEDFYSDGSYEDPNKSPLLDLFHDDSLYSDEENAEISDYISNHYNDIKDKLVSYFEEYKSNDDDYRFAMDKSSEDEHADDRYDQRMDDKLI